MEGDVDDSTTASREVLEDIGLDPHLVQVVANLETFTSQVQTVMFSLIIYTFTMVMAHVMGHAVGRFNFF